MMQQSINCLYSQSLGFPLVLPKTAEENILSTFRSSFMVQNLHKFVTRLKRTLMKSPPPPPPCDQPFQVGVLDWPSVKEHVPMQESQLTRPEVVSHQHSVALARVSAALRVGLLPKGVNSALGGCQGGKGGLVRKSNSSCCAIILPALLCIIFPHFFFFFRVVECHV